MFGSSRRNTFRPTAYGSTRRKRRIPRWLVLMLAGVVIGAGGLLFLQKSYGPTRLTVEQSEQLHYDLNSANLERQRLQSELNQRTHDLKQAQASLEDQTARTGKARGRMETLQEDIERFLSAMPPDPRGTSPGIRAADFRNQDGALHYAVLVMQDKEKAQLFKGEMELVVEGRYRNGRAGHVTLPAVEVALERYTHLSGEAALPENFNPRQVTIRITPEGSKKLAATRTILVSR